MRNTKERVFSVLVSLMLCCLTVIPAAAIDTPWLTLTPDGGENETTVTEPAPPVQPTDPETDGTEESGTPDSTASNQPQIDANAPQSSECEENSSAPQSQQTEEFRTEESLETEASKGCSSATSGFGWMAMIGGVWMLCRTKHGEKKEVNE